MFAGTEKVEFKVKIWDATNTEKRVIFFKGMPQCTGNNKGGLLSV